MYFPFYFCWYASQLVRTCRLRIDTCVQNSKTFSSKEPLQDDKAFDGTLGATTRRTRVAKFQLFTDYWRAKSCLESLANFTAPVTASFSTSELNFYIIDNMYAGDKLRKSVRIPAFISPTRHTHTRNTSSFARAFVVFIVRQRRDPTRSVKFAPMYL